jgi:DNA processing protein
MAPAALPLVPPDLTEDQRRVFGALVEEAVHVDQVGRTLGLPPQRLGVLLVELELLGLVKELPGKRYTRI